jgi:antitoxin component YwqK of YwqJK toxin-antitoxin module
MMRCLFPVIFLFVCQLTFGQSTSINTLTSWFSKSDKASIQSYFEGHSYRLFDEKDSLDFHIIHYSLVKTEQGISLHSYLLLNDSLPEFISFETCQHQEQQSILNQLKAAKFKLLTTDINGNFITSTYDNGLFLVHQDYQAINNPIGKGEIAFYRFRIFRKYGKFDTMNGEKISFSENATKISENYKNGLLDGERTIYFPNGIIKRKENYRAGRLNGLASDFNEEGKLIHTSTHSYHWKYGMEKWYNSDGKMVKSLQWQRDLPVGIEKQIFNGTVVESIPYVKGVKQGLAKVPIYDHNSIEANYPLDTLNDAPFAIETVNFANGLKTGKAVGRYFNQNDTMYVGFYKAGKLDSTYLLYGQHGILYSTNFSNGFENGARIYRISSGPFKDSIYRIEIYTNGKLEGKVVQYYDKKQDQLIQDPDSDFHLDRRIDSTTTLSEQWKKSYREEHYKDGVRDGSFIYQQDPLNYAIEFYVNGKLEGIQEYRLFSDGKTIKMTRNYLNGKKTGEWSTENVTDSILLIEHYKNNKKDGDQLRTLKNQLVERLIYSDGVLVKIYSVDENGNSDSFDMNESDSGDSVTVNHSKKTGDTSILICYSFSRTDFPWKDTSLLLMANNIQASPAENIAANGLYSLITPQFASYTLFKNRKIDGEQIIMYGKGGTGIKELLIYKEGSLMETRYREYKNAIDIGPYSGVFFSDYSNERISVKDGVRHGWCIQYDKNHHEVRSTKYVKGVAKKTVER